MRALGSAVELATARAIRITFCLGVLLAAVVAGSADGLAQIYAPPPPQYEVVPPPPPGPAAVVWRPGHWGWTDRGYVWIAGHYARPPQHRAMWVPGHWVEGRRGWLWVEGHWR